MKMSIVIIVLQPRGDAELSSEYDRHCLYSLSLGRACIEASSDTRIGKTCG